jgi:hypothetical protein
MTKITNMQVKHLQKIVVMQNYEYSFIPDRKIKISVIFKNRNQISTPPALPLFPSPPDPAACPGS